MAAKAKYLQNVVVAKYVEETFKDKNNTDPLQASIDTIWQKILDFYFTTRCNFITETQAYPDSDQDLTRSNIAVTTIDKGKLKKVLIIEAKRFPRSRPDLWYKDTRKQIWVKPQEQLRGYMLKSRGYISRSAWDHPMYGMVVVGDRVRFFRLEPRSTDLVEYKPPVLSPQEQNMSPFSVIEHSLLIEKVLNSIASEFKRNRT